MLSWIINGQETQLDDRENGIILLSHDGLGMPDFHRLEQRGPLQDGVTDEGYRLDARTIVLLLGVRGSNPEEFYNRRNQLLKVFKPGNNPGILRWTLGSVTREIEGYLIGGLQFSGNDQNYLVQKTPVSIKCPDPTWYDPSGKSIEFGIGGGGDTMEVPLVIPMTVGASSIDSTQQIIYNGSVKAFPIITIQGPVTNCIITQNTTGDKLDFTGYTIPAGTIYTIDTRYGYKTILDQNGISHISELTDDSDLSTWCLEPDPEAEGGANSIRVQGSEITAETAINLQYYERHIGV